MRLKQSVKNVLPAPLFHLLRDLPARLQGWFKSAPVGQGPIPPLHLMFDGPRDYASFINNGKQTLEFYKDAVDLKPGDSILDIGCGIGRKTIPLLNYFNSEALYVGIDIDRRGIDWLARNVTSQNQRFAFLHLDLYNKFYNPKGALDPSRLVFPFPANSFDVVALWSVFTHMYPRDIEHYLSEISRVLKPGGRIAASYFVFNDEILSRMQTPGSKLNFSHQLENCRTTNPNMPEDALAVSCEWLLQRHEKLQLKPQPVIFGDWSGHIPSSNFQDIVVATRT